MEIIIQIVLAVISAIATGVVGYFFYKFKKYEASFKSERESHLQEILRRDDAVVGALRALCSERILQIYVENKKQNSITKQKMDMAGSLYFAYHKLGGNGTITAVFENILQLPIKEGG